MSIFFYDDFYLKQVENSKYPTGGATKQVISWHSALKENGVDSKVIGASSSQKLSNYDDIIITYNPNKGMRFIRFIFYQLPSLIKLLKEHKPDYLYHGAPSRQAGILALICRFLKIKFVQRISNDNLTDHRIKSRLGFFEYLIFKQCLIRADYILCQNQYQFDNLSTKYSKKLHILTNPYKGTISDFIIPYNERKYIVWIGLFQHQKNVPLLEEIIQKTPQFNFKIIGTSAINCDNDTKVAINKIEQCKNAEFVGFKESAELSTYLKNAICLLNTSRYEGFSNTYLEAFATGTPVVCMSNCDPNSVIKNKNLGRTANKCNDLQQTLLNFISDESIWFQSAENCIPYVRKNHFYKIKINEFLSCINAK